MSQAYSGAVQSSDRGREQRCHHDPVGQSDHFRIHQVNIRTDQRRKMHDHRQLLSGRGIQPDSTDQRRCSAAVALERSQFFRAVGKDRLQCTGNERICRADRSGSDPDPHDRCIQRTWVLQLTWHCCCMLSSYSTSWHAMGSVLTLPGIAGLILSVGMAVDANVIIFARIREEISAGKTVRVATQEGFKRAMATVIDSQVTTLIAAVILYEIGTSSVKGFAWTFMIGIVVRNIHGCRGYSALCGHHGETVRELGKRSMFGINKNRPEHHSRIHKRTSFYSAIERYSMLISVADPGTGTRVRHSQRHELRDRLHRRHHDPDGYGQDGQDSRGRKGHRRATSWIRRSSTPEKATMRS